MFDHRNFVNNVVKKPMFMDDVFISLVFVVITGSLWIISKQVGSLVKEILIKWGKILHLKCDVIAQNCIRRQEVLFAGMCSCFRSSSVPHSESKRKQELKEETVSLSVSARLKDIMVRVVHAGGRIEMYHNAIPASKLIQNYPGMCLARPDVFNSPHESVLSDDDILLPGNKYFLVRRSTMEKLKKRHSKRGRTNEPAASDEPILNSREIEDVGDICFEESVCSAKDFFVSEESWSSFVLKRRVKSKRPFVPPIQRPRLSKAPEWEPSLTSIQELSP